MDFAHAAYEFGSWAYAQHPWKAAFATAAAAIALRVGIRSAVAKWRAHQENQRALAENFARTPYPKPLKLPPHSCEL